VLSGNDYTATVVGRLYDFLNRHAPWHTALWGIGTALSLDEVIEYSDLTRLGAFPNKEGLNYVCASAQRNVAEDPGASPASLRSALEAALDPTKVAVEAGADTLRHLVDRLRTHYMVRLADEARSATPPGVEALASWSVSHLLDSGFSPSFVQRWLHDLERVDTRTLTIADILEEANLLCHAPLEEFEIVVPFVSIPGGYAGSMPISWLTATETKQWITQQNPPPVGDHRANGAVKLKLEARDAASAVEVVADAVAQVAARVEVGSRLGHLVPKGVAWVAGDSKEYRLRAQTRVQLRSLKTAEHMYDISFAPEDAVVHDAVEIFASLASGSRGSALTGGWAVIEGLLLRPTEKPDIQAADRLADIVACAFPRAELTALSYRHKPTADALGQELAQLTINIDRCRVVERHIKNGGTLVVARASDEAMQRRVISMIAAPEVKLPNVRRYVAETFRRLYTQRNLIMHGGSFRSVTLRATLRTAPKLVAAGIDRVLDARLNEARTTPLALAARAQAELSLLGTPAARELCDLLS
jgi:hypothetical protein